MENIPSILVIDDLFGRKIPGDVNRARADLCASLLLADQSSGRDDAEVGQPIAKAHFMRGQTPESAGVLDVVENDLGGTLNAIRKGWRDALRGERTPWAMVLLDLCFYTGMVTEDSHARAPGMPEGRPGDDDPAHYFGLTLLDKIHGEFPDIPIFILSSKPRDAVSRQFSELGALGFIARDDLKAPELLEYALFQHGLTPDFTGRIRGHSVPLLLALREARRAARHSENILIRGERGTGKELLAAYANRVFVSDPATGARPFVAVNAASLAPNLISSELFGIEAKTATGVDGRIGLIEAAMGGDLFLDEIADMAHDAQSAIMRTLQERQVTKIGARKSKGVDVRFLSATNVDLEKPECGFRADLLDRLRMGGTLWLPPLRERRSDIRILAAHIVRDAERKRIGAKRRDISSDVMNRLFEHDWPGNIRELRACLVDAVNRFPDVEHLVPEHLRISDQNPKAFASPQPRASQKVNRGPPEDRLTHLLEMQRELEFGLDDVEIWAGRLDELRRSQSWMLARYLAAALNATKRRTPDHPEGLIQIHPAVKMITGNSTLTASKAADIIKQLLGSLQDELQGDLREALSIATRLRPRSTQKRDSEG